MKKFILANKWYILAAVLLLIVVIYLIAHNKAQDKKEHAKKKAIGSKAPKKQDAEKQAAPIDDGTSQIPELLRNPNPPAPSPSQKAAADQAENTSTNFILNPTGDTSPL